MNSNKSNEIKEKARNISQLDPIEDNDDEDDEISSVITDSSVGKKCMPKKNDQFIINTSTFCFYLLYSIRH